MFPSVAPKVRVEEESPLALVLLLALERDPLPEVITQFTVSLGTVLLFASFTTATNAGNAVSCAAYPLFPELTAIAAAGPGVKVIEAVFPTIGVPFTLTNVKVALPGATVVGLVQNVRYVPEPP